MTPYQYYKIFQAKRLAKKIHKGQKYGKHDYFDYHVMNVYNRVKSKGYGYEYQIVALLHDTIEDTDKFCPYSVFRLEIEIEDKFGIDIMCSVSKLTHFKKNTIMGVTMGRTYNGYISNIGAQGMLYLDKTKVVKICDLEENLSHCVEGDSRIKRYTKALKILNK